MFKEKLKEIIIFTFIFFQISILAANEDWIEIKSYKFSGKINGEMFSPSNKNILNWEEEKALSKYIKKKTPYQDGVDIDLEIKTDIIKNYKLIYISPLFHIPHNPGCYMAVQKNGKRIHRFSWFELEDIKTKFLIKIEDFKFFSEILKKEFKKIDNPNIAVELCHIFLILVEEIKSSVILSNIEDLKRFKGDFCSGLNKTEMKELSAILHLPQYLKKKKELQIKFLICSKDFPKLSEKYNGKVYFGEYHFKISQKNSIDIIGKKNIAIDTKNNCDILITECRR